MMTYVAVGIFLISLTSLSASVQEFQEIISIGGIQEEKSDCHPYCPGTTDELPIPTEIIEAISSNMSISQCLRVYGFILGYYKIKEQRMPMNLQELKAYAKKYANKKLKSSEVQTCSSTLHRWNRKMALSSDVSQVCIK